MSQVYMTSDAWEEFSYAFEQFTAVVTHLRSPEAQQLDHGQVEQFLETEGRELLRRLLQGPTRMLPAPTTRDWSAPVPSRA